jgi:hypothetical protein
MNPFDSNNGSRPETRGEVGPRATHRESLFLGVEIARTGATLSGRIRNISATGALVEPEVALPMGEHLTLTFRGVPGIGATVVRKTAKGVGVRFDHEIDPAACRQSVTAPRDLLPAWLPPPMTPRFRAPAKGRTR